MPGLLALLQSFWQQVTSVNSCSHLGGTAHLTAHRFFAGKFLIPQVSHKAATRMEWASAAKAQRNNLGNFFFFKSAVL